MAQDGTETRGRPLVALGAILALAAALRLSTLSLQSYWYDEAATVSLVRKGLGPMLRRIPDMEGNPPLYYVLAWAWARLFGTGETAVRSLSAAFGIAAVAVVYAIARRLAGTAAALAAALLAATAPFLVWFSQEARNYSLLVLLVALATLFWVRLLADGPPGPARSAWAAWTACSVLALATHYFAALFVAPMALELLRARRRRALPWLAGVTLGAAALAPLALHQHDHARKSIVGGFATRAAQLPKQLLVGYHAPSDRTLAVLSAVLVGAGLWRALREPALRRRLAAPAGLALGALALVGLLAVAGLDYLDSRNMLGLLVVLPVLAGAGLAAGGRAGRAALALLAAIGSTMVVIVAGNPAAQRDDWRGALDALGRPRTPRALVVTPGQAALPLAVYLPHLTPLPGSGAAVAEIDVLAMADRGSGEAPAPPPPRLPQLPPSFHPLALRRTALYTVERFVAPAPIGMPPTVIANAHLGRQRPLLYLQAPEGAH